MRARELPQVFGEGASIIRALADWRAILNPLLRAAANLPTSEQAAAAGVFVDAETPTPAPDAVTLDFALLYEPNPPSSLQLFRNGVIETGYTLLAKTLTLTSAPAVGETLLCWYRR